MEQTHENKMGTMPINKLLLSMSVPLMISMLVQALYNVVDSYFVAKVSEDALTAVTVAFPVQNLMIAVSVGLGVGVNAVLSRFLGEKNFEAANKTAMQGIVLELFSSVLFMVVGLVGSRAFIATQTDSWVILDYGTDYLWICCVFSVGLFLQVVTERLLQATGRAMLSMVTQGVGALVNIVMDPILIFGLCGFPKMEVAGAAVATVAGQLVAGLLGLLLNVWCNKELKLRIRYMIPDFAVMGRVLLIGVPSIVLSALGSLMTFCMNKILMAFSSTAVAVFGVYFKLQSFVFMPVFGLNNGMVPIVAYNLGAQNRKRITKTVSTAVIYAVSIMAVGLLAVQLFPAQILGIFDASPQMLEIGIPALRTISLCFLMAGVNIVIISTCQALGRSIFSMFVSMVRQLVVLIPAAFLLSQTGVVSAVWWAFPIAEVVCLAMCLVMLKVVMRRLKF